MERVKKKRRVRYTAKDKARMAVAGVFFTALVALVVGYIRYRSLFTV